MFAVIYRAYLKTGTESEYQNLWNLVVHYFVKYCGALGSCLHKTEEGYWLAYSRWPNKATRDAAWPGENMPSTALPNEIGQAIIGIKNCIDQTRQFPEICMEVKNDLLIPQTESSFL